MFDRLNAQNRYASAEGAPSAVCVGMSVGRFGERTRCRRREDELALLQSGRPAHKPSWLSASAYEQLPRSLDAKGPSHSSNSPSAKAMRHLWRQLGSLLA